MKSFKKNMFGFAHHAVLGLVVVGLVSAIGVKVLTASHAAPLPSYTNGKIYYGGYMRNPDGSGLTKLSGLDGSSVNLSNMSYDGTQVAYWGFNSGSPTTIYKGTITNSGLITNISTMASLPSGDGPNTPPVWSPDGTKVANTIYTASGEELWVANTNGSGGHYVSNVPKNIGDYISWRPGSENIVYSPNRYAYGTNDTAKNSKICSVSIAGKDWGCHSIPLGSLKPVSALGDGGISVSPDGNKVALVTANDLISSYHPSSADIYVVNSRGGGLTRLTSSTKGEYVLSVVWSPDGTKIAYLLDDTFRGPHDTTGLYVMNADGTGKKQISNYSALGVDLAFQNTLSWAHQ